MDLICTFSDVFLILANEIRKTENTFLEDLVIIEIGRVTDKSMLCCYLLSSYLPMYICDL